MGALLFAAASAALSVLAARLAQRVLPSARLAEQLLATLLLFVALSCGVLLGLGTAGLLRSGPIALASLALLGLELTVSARERRPPRPGDQSAPRSNARTPHSERIGLALLCGVLAWWAGLTLGSGTGFVWDDLAYHATLPAWWARTGTLEVVPLNYQGYYPANAELFALWFVAPFRSDALANASVFAWLALLALGFAAIAREHELALLPVALALACFVLSPAVGFFAGTFSANDLALAALGVAMLAFAGCGDERGGAGRALLSGLAGGLALGTKVSIAPQVALVALWWGSRQLGGGPRAQRLGLFSAGVLLGGGYWYARNWLLTGNPIYPAELGPFDGPFSSEAQYRTTLVPTILEGWTRPRFWLRFMNRRLDWPLTLGIVSLAGYALGLLFTARGAEGRRRRYWILLALAGLLFFALFPLQPFSGTNNRPTSGLHHPIRYLALPFALGLLLFASAARRQNGARVLAVSAALALAALAVTPDFAGRGLWWAGGVAFALLALAIAERRCAPWPAWLGPLALAAPWPLLALAAPSLERASGERLDAFGEGRPLGAAWRALEELPDGVRVATITHDPASHALYRPLFGRALRFEPVAVDGAGRAEPALHERSASAEGWWADFEPAPPVTPDELRRNLAAARVEFLLVAKWPSWPKDKQGQREPPWPSAKAALEEFAGARCIHSDGYSELWDLRGAGAGPAQRR